MNIQWIVSKPTHQGNPGNVLDCTGCQNLSNPTHQGDPGNVLDCTGFILVNRNTLGP